MVEMNILEEVGKLLDKKAMISTHFDSETKEVDAILIYSENIKKHDLYSFVLTNAGFWDFEKVNEIIAIFDTYSPEELENIKKLAKIKSLKKEVELLEKEITLN